MFFSALMRHSWFGLFVSCNYKTLKIQEKGNKLEKTHLAVEYDFAVGECLEAQVHLFGARRLVLPAGLLHRFHNQ